MAHSIYFVTVKQQRTFSKTVLSIRKLYTRDIASYPGAKGAGLTRPQHSNLPLLAGTVGKEMKNGAKTCPLALRLAQIV